MLSDIRLAATRRLEVPDQVTDLLLVEFRLGSKLYAAGDGFRRPSMERSLISSRSNSPMAAKMLNCSLPYMVVVSIPWSSTDQVDLFALQLLDNSCQVYDGTSQSVELGDDKDIFISHIVQSFL
jgi:hypothetical protein